ncbi:lysophospholipid acyltransferase family protein [Bacillus sp. NTK074B]|uniref:lysophospholipid acyltransferase family protein n=1 Tax=Bacillus sp. NTK074B TaxID=2802174 RepID=UPI001FD4EB88
MIYVLIYMGLYLLYSVPTLQKVKKLDSSMSVRMRDQIIHDLPKRWSRGIMKRTGSNVHISGHESIPEGPVLFVANHAGDFDVPVLLGSIPKPFGFISKMEVKKLPIISDWMIMISCIFIDRSNRRQAVQSIKEGGMVLKAGHSLLIFPEGTRNKGGELKDFKTGGIRMAKYAGVPIVPVVIQGTADMFENQPRGIKPCDIFVEILSPLSAQYVGDTDVKELSIEVQGIIQASLDQMRRVS